MEFTPRPDPSGCILCGRCVRACRAVGRHVMGFSGRGRNRRVGVPFDRPPSTCIGCRSCEQVCPVNVIRVVEDRGRITVLPWQAETALLYCPKCGAAVGSRDQAESLKKFSPTGPLTGLCPACRRRYQASLAGSPGPPAL